MDADALTLPRKPRFISHLIVLVLLLPIWVVILEFGVRPRSLDMPTSRCLLAWYLLPPLLLVVGSYALLWTHHTTKARAIQAQQNAEQQAALAAQEQQKKDAAVHTAKTLAHETFSLEVMGLGLSLEKNRNAQVWDRMEETHHMASILPTDPKAYPWSKEQKEQYYEKRCQDALTQAGDWFTEHWEMPLFLAGPDLNNTEYLGHLVTPMRNDLLKNRDGGDRYPLIGDFTGARMETAMESHPFTVMQVYHSAAPEQVLPDVFAFFDAHPEVPAVMVYALDSLSGRSLLRDFSLPMDTVDDGYRKPGELTESITGLVLARRDRVEAMRAFSEQEAPPRHHLPWGHPKANGNGKAAFHPTGFLPKPWDKWQLIQFDRLPVLGRIHRPKTVSYLRPDGKPMKPSERHAAFAAGWKAALGTLPDGKLPARVLYDHGPAKQGARLTQLDLALHNVGPELDLNHDCINLNRCLGDLGADASFVNVAVGVYASHRRNDVTACVSLRQENSTMILMVSPPTGEERKVLHPGGKDHVNMHDSYGVEPYGWLPAADRPKGMLVHSAYRIED